MKELPHQKSFNFLREWLSDEPGYHFKNGHKNYEWDFSAAPVEIWLSSIHSILSLPLNWSSGTLLLQNNKFPHHNNHMSWVFPGEDASGCPDPVVLLSVSARWSLTAICCTTKMDQDEVLSFQIWIKKSTTYSVKSLGLNLQSVMLWKLSVWTVSLTLLPCLKDQIYLDN